jgi:hypothetical protein
MHHARTTDLLLALAAPVLLLLAACSSPPRPPVLVPRPAPGEIVSSLFLIGDAGKPDKDDKILAALMRQASEAPSPTIVFLGDNLYYYGMPDTSALDLKDYEERLLWQMNTGLASRAPTYFIPGNHDWQAGRDSGWAAIRRQEAYILAHGQEIVHFLPSGGCPGPEVRELPGSVRLVILDSQWFLHTGPKPVEECRPNTVSGVMDSLERVLRVPPGTDVVVAMHHPMRTHGEHGGHFTWVDHIFPLRLVVEDLYLPLPIIGSLYPIARMNGVSDQDLSGGRNELLRERLYEVFRKAPPRATVHGHEHSLQVLTDPVIPSVLVSGTGYDGHVGPVAWERDTRFAAPESGYMRIDRLTDGRLRLAVLRPQEDSVDELHSEWLPPVPR